MARLILPTLRTSFSMNSLINSTTKITQPTECRHWQRAKISRPGAKLWDRSLRRCALLMKVEYRRCYTYGATDPVEFFAVSVEAFFERPRALRTYHPKLYAELQNYFRQDPVEYSAEQTYW